MVRSNKIQITREEYYQLIGLRELAKQHWLALDEIDKAAQKITEEQSNNGEPEFGGHTSDFLSGSRELCEMLQLLKIKVIKEAKK
jgi:hypothetical protein